MNDRASPIPTSVLALPASLWRERAGAGERALRKALEAVYGAKSDLIADRLRRIADMADRYVQAFGDSPVVLARAPGRVNLMGRHIDHQGGHCNMMAIEPDVYIMAGHGPAGQLRARNLDRDRFPDADVSLGDMLTGYKGGAWADYVNRADVRERARAAGGAWYYYLVAAMARLTADDPTNTPKGVQCVVAGDVPVAAGLSSSSALVVAASEALLALMNRSLPAERFVTLCSEAEWYVGTRGGAGDQAAMRYARPGMVLQLGFHPLSVGEAAPWPEDCVLLVANSGYEARKSGNARDVFNQRVACYHIGREMLLRRYPELRCRVQHLRDLTPQALGWDDGTVADMVRALPEALPREEVPSAVGRELAERWLATHDCGDAPYPVRGVVLFGLAECERSRQCVGLLRAGELERVGHLMQVSHDGDRVSSHSRHWPWPQGKPYDDEALGDVIRRCRNGHALAEEPGAYACSTTAIDQMVDLLLEVPGVYGAQLSGAGLGGSMMALMRAGALEAAQSALNEHYYHPRGLRPLMLVCRPCAGCGPITL